jgi:DNA-directed RNA polymerase specialized sigma24 family protein
MFSDLTDLEREALVEIAVEAWTFAWGPRGRPAEVEPWLALGMYHAMMAEFRQRRMLRRPVRAGDALALDGLLEEWMSAEAAPDDGELPVVDSALTDRFLRLLSPADARLLWMRCEGYTREEIAELIGIRPNAVSVRLRRLQIRLRDAVEPIADHASGLWARPGSGAGVG